MSGRALDANNNVYIYEGIPIPAVIQKFSPSGSFLGAVPEPEKSIAVALGHLTLDPRTGLIIGLKSDGVLFTLDTTGRTTILANLSSINWDETAIYDVQISRVNPALAGQILPFRTNFGRISAFAAGNDRAVDLG